MGLRNLSQKLAEKRARRRWRLLHPAVGLPKDAPEHLETDNGSVMRVLPESEHVPLPTLASAAEYYLFASLALGLLLTIAAAAVLIQFLSKEPEPPDWVGYLLLTVVFMLPLIGGLLASARFDSRNRRRMIELVASRPSHLFDPAEGDFLLDVNPSEIFGSLPGHDSAFVRALPGFLEFEMSRAQVRLAADDLRMYLRTDNLRRTPGVSLRCDFGDHEFALDASIENTRRGLKNLKLGLLDRFSLKRRSRTFARHLQSRMGLPVGDIDYPPEEEITPKVPVPLVFSSESEESRSRVRLYKAVFCLGLLVWEVVFLGNLLIAVADIFSSSEPTSLQDWCLIVLLALVAVGMPVATIGSLRSLKRGKWLFDAEKVVYEPLDGAALEISWDEIDRVRWEQKKIELVGRRGSISLDSWSFGWPEFSRARQVIRRCLGSTFDLSLTPIRQGVLFPVCGIVLLLGAMALYVGIKEWDESPSVRWPWLAFWLTVTVISSASLVVIVRRKCQRARDLNPKWRERKRGGATASLP